VTAGWVVVVVVPACGSLVTVTAPEAGALAVVWVVVVSANAVVARHTLAIPNTVINFFISNSLYYEAVLTITSDFYYVSSIQLGIINKFPTRWQASIAKILYDH
jgi:hypothetical protein